MTAAIKWMFRGALGIVGVAALSLLLIYNLAVRSLPDYNGNFVVDGISAPVEIIRDNANVPHIFGQTDADAYFGLGFAHAQDRLWQMTVMRRTAQGRLSELFGASTLQLDQLMRRFDLYNLATQSVAAQDAYTQAALQAYANGVNAWLSEVNNGARGRGAPEFFLFEPRLPPWQPADSIAIAKLMAFEQMTHLPDEVLRARTALVIEPERLRDILPDAPGSGVAALPKLTDLFPGLSGQRFAQMSKSAPHHPLSPLNPRGHAGASNMWAAAPSRSAAGGTLLANDPHTKLTAPSFWYLARLELETGGVIGGTIPGLPSIIVGRSDKLGWGITNSYLDDLDVYIERLNPDDANQVAGPDGWVDMRRRDTIINIKDQSPVTVTLRWTENGPVLPESLYDLGMITPPGHVTALAWTALWSDDTSLSASLRLMRAQDIAQAREAVATHVAPALNLLLVDRDNIAMQLIGAMPRRSAMHETKGRIPTPGWRLENRWQNRFDYSQNPSFVAPTGGLLANSNNKFVDTPFPNHISYSWGDTQRVQRWQRLMQNRQVHTRESFVEAQLDTVSPTARALLPLIAADLWFTGTAAAQGTPERQRQRALTLLAEWTGEMNEHLPEPLIYAAWLRAIQERLIRDELGPLANSFSQVDGLFIERVYRNVDGAGVWCDIVQSAPVETCEDIARLALDDALIWIGDTYGTALESLRWGDAHQAVHRHPVLGAQSSLSWLVNIRQSTSGGDNTLMVGKTSGTDPRPFENIHGAGYRGVYDFADPNSSVFIISTGQSGHPLSRHYDDMGVLWRRGEYVPMSLDPELARAGAVGETLLRPSPIE